MIDFPLRAMGPADRSAVAALVHGGTNAWYEARGHGPIFRCTAADVEALFCRVYEDLDPGCCVVAEVDGEILGSCFYHPRSTHVALGIMNVDPDAFGRGVARRLLEFVIDVAERTGVPVRLVSSAMNLDSFSLYSRAGFRPYAVFQDMLLEVPSDGFIGTPPGRDRVRPARPDDVRRMSELERELTGIEREKDYRYFLTNEQGIWHASVLEDDAGVMQGHLVSVAHPASRMLGPGVARDDVAALALLAAELDVHRGATPVWLVPADRPNLTAELYRWGARNCELHLGQVRGVARMPAGVVFPTFMPETG